ncbi:MAG: LPS export ABC transporter periplasmic protein LptC [Atribacterota bacterium]
MILVVAIGCCGILIIFLLLRSHSPETSQSASEKEGEEKVSKEPPVTMTQARIKGWGRGKLSWSMETEKMKLDKQNTQALCRDGVEIRVFRDNGEINATLTSRAASINLDEKEFQLNDRVEVVSDTGDRIQTDLLFYHDQGKILESPSSTRVFFDQNFIECIGFISDIDFKKPEFYSILQGKFSIGQKE